MKTQKMVDHLFRHQYGKMVSILTNIFGLSNIELVEDAVQDTFSKALLLWRSGVPPNPEAWLTQAAKNRAIDLLRQVQAEKSRFEKLTQGPSSLQLNELFLDHEIEDSQLRMIFVACHPELDPKEQIAFALKTISGFSTREIASALLIKEETVKKRLSRARKKIAKEGITFDFPPAHLVPKRLSRIMEIVYLIFNEGFHSNHPKQLVRKDLCGEALRLCKLLLKKSEFRSGSLYALLGLMCFHAARLESKVNEDNEIVSLRYQDRSKWSCDLIVFANNIMVKAMEYEEISPYHYEALIASEHVKARSFEDTDWEKILKYYEWLHQLHPATSNLLNMAMVQIQLANYKGALKLLNEVSPEELGPRVYLYYGCFSEYHKQQSEFQLALDFIDKAIDTCSNQLEQAHLKREREKLKEDLKSS